MRYVLITVKIILGYKVSKTTHGRFFMSLAE